MKLICGGFLNFSEILNKLPVGPTYCVECDCKIWIISDSGFEFLRPQQIRDAPFDFWGGGPRLFLKKMFVFKFL